MRRLFLGGARLVTLVGPPGIGKSRLAHEFAQEHGVVVLDDPRLEELPAEPAVATAREPLGVAGEHVYRLKPLAEAPAVELFREHAPGAEATYAELAERVREVGRLPGAIERAARGLRRSARR